MNKLKLILISTCILLSTFAFTQTSSSENRFNNWSIGINIMNEYDSFKPILNSSFRPHFFNGIIIKRNFKSISIRTSIEHVNFLYKEEDFFHDIDMMYLDGYNRETSLLLGIEKSMTLKKIFKPYIALDISGTKSFSNFTGAGGFSGNRFHSLTNAYSLGINPSIGLIVNITNHFSISIETRYQIASTKYNKKYKNLTLDTDVTNNQGNYNSRTLKSIGALTLNYDF